MAKRPIPADATIPLEDAEKHGRLTLKIWPPESLPESILFDLDGSNKNNLNNPLLKGMGISDPDAIANQQYEATLKSSFDESKNVFLPSMSSGTSYGKEPVFDNTIEQILGNIERSNLGSRADMYQESFDYTKAFRR